MPKRTDIKRILVIGSGPIVIGQACEFDYSGAQACKVLKEDGYEVVLVNSNPATIMTDPSLADRTYVEPITAEFIERVIAKEHPDALLPTLGGQTGLNAAVELAKSGVLDRYGVEMIGCDLAAIERGEDRKLFAEAMEEIGLECARSGYAYSVEDAVELAGKVGYPCVLRPSFTLGGAGGGIAYDEQELREMKPTAVLVNTARAVLVDMEALYTALKEHWIMGAAVDVFPMEPLPKDYKLLTLDNITLTNHRGGDTINSYIKAPELLLQQFDELLTTGTTRCLIQ